MDKTADSNDKNLLRAIEFTERFKDKNVEESDAEFEEWLNK